jgi:hypothetical protein
MSILRLLLFTFAAGALVLGASGILSPGVSSLLWLSSAILLACHPSSPLVRAISNAMLRNGKYR